MISSMITVVAEMFARPGRERDLKSELLAMVELTRKEEGCIQYDLHVDDTQPTHFVFYEKWTTHEALDRHAASPHLQSFAIKSTALLMHPPRVGTYTRVA